MTADTFQSDQQKRLFSLDILRGVAISMVLIRHFPPSAITIRGGGELIAGWLNAIGWIGVDLFFVLSGFLISSLIYSEYDKYGSFKPGRFLLRRGFKIWPAYYAAYGGMTFARIAAEYFKGNQVGAWNLVDSGICNALFVQNYLSCERWSHSWSLAIEEHFYTGLALLLWVITVRAASRGQVGKKAYAILLPISAGIAIAVLAFRIAACFPDYNWHYAYYRTHMRVDALMCGVALGYLVRYSNIDRLRTFGNWPVVCLGLMVAVVWATLFPHGESPWDESIGLTVIYLGFSVAVLSAYLNPNFGRQFSGIKGGVAKLMAWLGVYSYTIYLAHAVLFGVPGVETLRQMFLAKLHAWLPDWAIMWTDRLMYLCASVMLGLLLSRLVERPFLKLRSHLLPSRSSGVGSGVSIRNVQVRSEIV